MKIETKEVREGKHDGKIVWISSYNRPDINKKPLRDIKPVKVIICRNIDKIETASVEGKRPFKVIYYSESHFSPLKKDGVTPTAKIISPVDNTGYRFRCGNEVDVFTTQEEAEKSYNKQYEACHPAPTHVSVEIEQLDVARVWLKSCLECKEWVWCPEQKAAAKESLDWMNGILGKVEK